MPDKRAVSKNSSGTQDASAASLVVFSRVAYTPGLRGDEDGEDRRTRTGLGGAAGNCDRGVAAPNVIGGFPRSEGKRHGRTGIDGLASIVVMW